MEKLVQNIFIHALQKRILLSDFEPAITVNLILDLPL